MINNDNQMATILMSMLPDAAADALLAKYEIGTDTFDGMQENCEITYPRWNRG